MTQAMELARANPKRPLAKRPMRPKGITTPGAHENPGGGFLTLLFGALLGAGGFWLYGKWRAKKGGITDGWLIAQAKKNLEIVSQQSQPTTSAQAQNAIAPFTYTHDQPVQSVTPAFTQGLATFQAAMNQALTPAKLQSIQQGVPAGFTLPPVPLRTDGVLDTATFDWLMFVAYG